MICLESGLFQKYLLFLKHQIFFLGIPSKHPKSFSVVSKQVQKRSASVIPRSLSAADMLRLGTLIRKENKNDVKVVIERLDIAKKEWKTVTPCVLCTYAFCRLCLQKSLYGKITTYPFQNKEWVIKTLNQSTITDLNDFEESSESLTRTPVQMNILAQYMAKSFQSLLEKEAFHFISGKHGITTTYTLEK